MAGRVWQIAWRLILLLAVLPERRTTAHGNKQYAVSSLCKNHFMQEVNRIVDGATVWSENERNLDCQLTFQTESILQRFVVRFERLQLDCNDHLYIHDSAHAIGDGYKADLSCRNTKDSVGVLYTRSNYVTLRYKTDAWGTRRNGFKVVITAYKPVRKDQTVDCDEFLCGRHCISRELLCDGVSHCPDGRDEATAAGCLDSGLASLLGTDRTLLYSVGAAVAVVTVATVLVVVVCSCRRKRRRRPHDNGAVSTFQLASAAPAGANGLRAGPPRASENWPPPAARRGSPRLAASSPSGSPPRGRAATRAVRPRMSGSCRGRSRRRGAWSAGPGSHVHAYICDVIGRWRQVILYSLDNVGIRAVGLM